MKRNSSAFSEYLSLFLAMMKIGLFTFGGGYAMLALIENEFVERKKYIDREEFMDMVAIAESTPGPIAINTATYIGYKRLGFFGALASTIGVIVPSFLIIFVISLFFDHFLSYPLVAHAFQGIQVAVIYLIFSAGFKMLRNMKKTTLSVSILTTVTLSMTVLSLLASRFSSIFYILISGGIGLFLYLLKVVKDKKEGAK